MKYLITAISLLVIHAGYARATTLAYTQDVKLPKKEALALENQVCGKPYNLAAKTLQGSKDKESKAAFDTAFVQCQAHGEFRGKPMHYQTGCSFSKRKWQCDETGLEVTANIQGTNVKIHPWGISPESAYQILAKISTYGTFQGTTMANAIGSSCHVTSSNKGEIVELNCNAIITVSFWCPQPALTNCPRVVYVTPHPH